MSVFSEEFLVLKLTLTSQNWWLYFSYHLISIKFEAADEIMAKVQDQFLEVKMDFRSKEIICMEA